MRRAPQREEEHWNRGVGCRRCHGQKSYAKRRKWVSSAPLGQAQREIRSWHQTTPPPSGDELSYLTFHAILLVRTTLLE